MGIDNKQQITNHQDNLNDALASLDALLDTPSAFSSYEPEFDHPANQPDMDLQDAATPELPDVDGYDSTDLFTGENRAIPRSEEQLELPVLRDLITSESHADSAAQEFPAASTGNRDDDRDTVRRQTLDDVKQHFGSFSDRVVQQCVDGFFDDYVETARQELAAHLARQLQETLEQVLDDLASLNPADDSRA